MGIRKFTIVFFILAFVGCASTGPSGLPARGKVDRPAPPKVDPKAAVAYEAALVSMRAGNHSRAESQFKKLIKDFPTFSGPHNNLGILYFHADKLEQSKSSFNNALKLNPHSVVSLNHLGIISRGEGDFKQAHDYYERALRSDPEYAYAHLNFGILLELYMGKLPEALEHYKRYQELTKEEDKKVKGWIIDLGRRVNK